ncbi:MAG: xanthine dehydrogenase family protein subunit M [Gemmatimonadota bacterium]
MKPAPFAYHRPATVEAALHLLAEHAGEAKPLAGGQSLIPTMNFRLSQPKVLIDLGDLDELRGIQAGRHGLHIGAMTTHAAVEASPVVADLAPLLAETMPFIAHPQIRNRGTIGGSLAHADPAAELPAVMLVLRAQFGLLSSRGHRKVKAADFYTGLFTTALEPQELLATIEIPKPEKRTGYAFAEIARRHGDYALVGVAGAVTLDRKGLCDGVRLALLSVGDGPVVCTGASQLMAGRAPTDDLIREAAEAVAAKDIDPPSDIHASAAYRRQLTRVLVARVIEQAAARAGGAAK